jgi:hypothetical protein
MTMTPAQGRIYSSAPERHRTLAEVCDLYFPGVTPCALRWMIKRRGYAHSRWGREYRLTDSQVAAIQEDLARPPRPAPGPRPGLRAESTRKPAASSQRPAEAARAPAPRRRPAPPRTDVRQALAEQLASPLAVAAVEHQLAVNRGEA